jgi:hypothetical protein
MEPIVSSWQAPSVPIGYRSFSDVEIDDIRRGFAVRMHELCDALKIPRGHGRNAALGRMFGFTPNAARKWLLGLSYPEMAHAVQMCDRAGINLLWLLQGTPPKRGNRIDAHALELAEGLRALPAENRQAVLEFMRYEFGRADGWFTNEALQRYLDTIDTLRRQSADTRPPPPST